MVVSSWSGESLFKNVVVLGAGPGGLAAAHHLAARGIQPFILEKLNHVAGLCHTHVREGYRFDIGGHRWFTKNEELERWFLELMRGELVRVKRSSRIYFDRKYYNYPIRTLNVLRNAGLFTSGHAVASYIAAQFSNAANGNATMETAYVQQFGRKLYEMFFQRYSEKVWGRPCTEISADWVEQRTKGLSILSALRSALGSRTVSESLIGEFWYPRMGYSRICERMAEDIRSGGGEIRLNSSVISVVHDTEQVRGVNYLTPEGQSAYAAADAVISSIPLPWLARNLSPLPPQDVAEAAKKLKFRDLITINVMIDREQVTQDTWLYIHDRDIPFARIHEPKNWSSAMAPPGKTSLVVELFCSIGDEMWKRTDEEICELAVHHLVHSLRFIEKQEVIGTFALRVPHAYPIYGLDYQKNLDIIKQYVAGVKHLQIIGRGGTFRYNNSDHSIEMGLLAAKNVLGEQHRIDKVNEAREYLEEKYVDVN